MVDADTERKEPAFDHARLAESLSRASGRAYSTTRLPFNTFTFNDALSAIEMTIDGSRWTCTLADYACRTPELPPPGEIRRGITGPVRGDIPAAAPRPRMSPDGKWMAFIDNYNVAIRPFGGEKRIALSTDGSEGNYYDGASIAWSPDSSKVVAYRVRPGYRRLVHYVASSPEDQLQPEHWAAQYAKPGDLLDLEQPVLFDVRSQKQIAIDSRLFPNPFDMSDLVWRKDSRALQLRIQPARPPGVSRDRSGRADRRRARDRLRRAKDVLLLQPQRGHAAGRQAVSLRPRRRQGSSSGCRSATAGIISI